MSNEAEPEGEFEAALKFLIDDLGYDAETARKILSQSPKFIKGKEKQETARLDR